jgi:hypothetical protein
MERRRRVRVTIRCLEQDLGIPLPGPGTDLGDIDHPVVEEARRVAPNSPEGQRRVQAIEHPPVFRIRHGRWRGATWVEEEAGLVWLLAAAMREEGSEDDAFEMFEALNAAGTLLPTEEDRRRDRLEEVTRLVAAIRRSAAEGLAEARRRPGEEIAWTLADRVRVLIFLTRGGGYEELWLAVPLRDLRGEVLGERLHNAIFVTFEEAAGAADWEYRDRHEWPTRPLEWFETAHLYLYLAEG